MAKPVAVQKLKHGKALCGATFDRFVESFNWLIDFCTGLRGDGDNNGNGTLSLDRTLDTAPTIRMLESENGGDGGDGGGGDGDEQEPEPGSQQDEPYQDPEDYPDGPPDADPDERPDEAYSADGNEISEDAGSEDLGAGNYCNTIGGFGGGGGSGGGGNEISNTCS